ncbi:MAG: lamin tail domain-containing protein [Candidatus Methanomethylophilaceae archaeon]|nr:lamin tail domain-containing protein [Candidatus Methanomethylophilaceae archaeon]
MDARSRTIAILMAVVMVFCAAPMVFEEGDASSADGVLIQEINPMVAPEGVSLKNYGSKAVDLKGYVISDGEGKITILKKIVIEPGEIITFAEKIESDSKFTNRNDAYVKSSDEISYDRSFQLSNDGDDIYLYNASGVLIDAVCYEDVVINDSSWSGESVTVSGKYFYHRSYGTDTDSAEDWFKYVEGLTNLEFDPNLKYNAQVTPFVFPQSGGVPIFRALEEAKESVYITMYELRSDKIAAFLIDLEKNRGVDVYILHNANPVKGTITEMLPNLKAIDDAGAEVRLIGVGDMDRYVHVHAKYCVIDGDTVIVTSENWNDTNLNGYTRDDDYYSSSNGNRGWGAVVESEPYADYVMDLFNVDWSMEYGDVSELEDVYPNANANKTLTYEKNESTATFKTYAATVSPVFSNDTSYDAMEYYLNKAKDRLYAQNQSLTSYYADISDERSPIYMMAKRASAGVDTKLILDTKNTPDNANLAYTINASTLIQATGMNIPPVHNKGIISDDSVWVSSINWTPNSVENNREAAVVIHSAEVADYYEHYFLMDFNRYYSYDGFSVDTSYLKNHYDSGDNEFVIGLPVGTYDIKWNFGDGKTTRDYNDYEITKDGDLCKALAAPEDGAHILTITVTNQDGMSQKITHSYSIGNYSDSEGTGGSDGSSSIEDIINDLPIPEEIKEYLLPIIVIILAIVIAVIKKLR